MQSQTTELRVRIPRDLMKSLKVAIAKREVRLPLAIRDAIKLWLTTPANGASK